MELTKVKAWESKRVEVRGMMQKAGFEDVKVKYLAQRRRGGEEEGEEEGEGRGVAALGSMRRV